MRIGGCGGFWWEKGDFLVKVMQNGQDGQKVMVDTSNRIYMTRLRSAIMHATFGAWWREM